MQKHIGENTLPNLAQRKREDTEKNADTYNESVKRLRATKSCTGA